MLDVWSLGSSRLPSRKATLLANSRPILEENVPEKPQMSVKISEKYYAKFATWLRFHETGLCSLEVCHAGGTEKQGHSAAIRDG